MLTIYKYPLLGTDEQTVRMPSGAMILSAGQQDGNFVLWARVDTTAPVVARKVLIVGTGHDAGETYRGPYVFVNTVQFPSGLVFHVFIGGGH